MTDTERKDSQIPIPQFVAVSIGGQQYMMPYNKVMLAIDNGFLVLDEVQGRLDITTKGWCYLIGIEVQ